MFELSAQPGSDDFMTLLRHRAKKKLKLGSDNDEGGVSPSPDFWSGILGLLKVHIGVP